MPVPSRQSPPETLPGTQDFDPPDAAIGMHGTVVTRDFGGMRFGREAGPPVAQEAAPGGRDLWAAELARERALARHPALAVFRRNATAWEALLIVATTEGTGPGLYELVAQVETRALGPSALLRFLREQRAAGTLLFTRSPAKRSKWTVALRPDLTAALRAILRQG